MQHITSFKPYMVGPGNHESNCDNGGTSGYTVQTCFEGQRNFTGIINHFRMPDSESGGVGPFWYSFDYGLVHFVNFNTETDLGKYGPGPDSVGGSDNMDSGEFGEDGEQIAWLKNDLKNVDRSKTPWVIAMGHRPWYVAAKKKHRCLECQAAFEKTFNKYGVDLVLLGHRHLYNRIHPIDDKGNIDPNGLNNPKAPWYIVNGAAGHYDGLDTAKNRRAVAGLLAGHSVRLVQIYCPQCHSSDSLFCGVIRQLSARHSDSVQESRSGNYKATG